MSDFAAAGLAGESSSPAPDAEGADG